MLGLGIDVEFMDSVTLQSNRLARAGPDGRRFSSLHQQHASLSNQASKFKPIEESKFEQSPRIMGDKRRTLATIMTQDEDAFEKTLPRANQATIDVQDEVQNQSER